MLFEVGQNRYRGLQTWYHTPAGKYLHDKIANCLLKSLEERKFTHFLQLGQINFEAWSHSFKAKQAWLLEKSPTVPAHIYANYHELPFAPGSIELIFLPHTLEYEVHPEKIIAECTRILQPMGLLVMIGFNPTSLYQLWVNHLQQKKPIWQGKLLSMRTLCQILNKEGYQIVDIDYVAPLPFPEWQYSYLNLVLERTGQLLWPGLGTLYQCIAQKQTPTLTPIKLKWKYQRELSPGQLISPV